MAIDSKHPLYDEHAPDWRQMRDTNEGERQVKEQGFAYLPPTSGMVADGALDTVNRTSPTSTSVGLDGTRYAHALNSGWEAYRAYRLRARFPDWVKEAVKALLGVMHNKPPTIELPSEMEPMRELATSRNESLEMLLQRINQEQLITGRLGLMADVIDEGERKDQLYLALYQAEDVINWDEGSRTTTEIQNLNLVVINEGENVRQSDLSWDFRNKYRVLVLGKVEDNEEPREGLVYRAGVFEEVEFSEEGLMEPMLRGKFLDEIPFVFCNSMDVVPEPEQPPLLGLSNLSLTIYRGEADYRQALFMQGQDTLVVIGALDDDEDGETRTGAGAKIDLPIGGDAKYIGVESSGLGEMRQAIENDDRRAMQQAGQLLDSVSRERESGDALKVRVAARTATLNRIALAGAFALREILRKCAKWMGADPEAVEVTPNLDFVDDQMTGQELTQFAGARATGAPLSKRSLHKLMTDRGVTEMTYEEELAELEKEREQELKELEEMQGTMNPDGPEDDPEDDPENDPEGGGQGRRGQGRQQSEPETAGAAG